MPTNIKVIRAKEFLKATLQGRVDLEESKQVLLQLASVHPSSPDFEVILDYRHAQSLMSITDLWYLAAELGKVRNLVGRKTAVLCLKERVGHAEFFALCAQNRGLQVQAFTAFEEAINWLTA